MTTIKDELGVHYTDDQIAEMHVAHSQEMARARHKDYDDTVNGFTYNAEQNQDIFANGDPAERAYQIAKEAQTHKPEPLSNILTTNSGEQTVSFDVGAKK